MGDGMLSQFTGKQIADGSFDFQHTWFVYFHKVFVDI